MCLSDGKQPTASSDLKIYKKSDIQIVNGNEKLKTILNQVNAPENSRKPIANIQSDFQSLASIITERLDSIQINEFYNYFRKETKEECKKTQQKIKQTNP